MKLLLILAFPYLYSRDLTENDEIAELSTRENKEFTVSYNYTCNMK